MKMAIINYINALKMGNDALLSCAHLGDSSRSAGVLRIQHPQGHQFQRVKSWNGQPVVCLLLDRLLLSRFFCVLEWAIYDLL
jgi:hypothetical protein